MINKEPVYIQINKALSQLIINDGYSVGDKFLTERSVCEMYRVSRSTANKSLSSLVSENILEFKKGIGTFIKSVPLKKNTDSLFNDPIDILNNQKLNFTVEIIPSPSPLYSDFTWIRRIALAQNIFAVELIYMPEKYSHILSTMDDRDSLVILLAKKPLINILETEDSLKSTISTETEKNLFNKEKDFPLIEISSRSLIENAGDSLLRKTFYNGEMTSLVFSAPSRTVSFKINLENSNNYHYI